MAYSENHTESESIVTLSLTYTQTNGNIVWRIFLTSLTYTNPTAPPPSWAPAAVVMVHSFAWRHIIYHITTTVDQQASMILWLLQTATNKAALERLGPQINPGKLQQTTTQKKPDHVRLEPFHIDNKRQAAFAHGIDLFGFGFESAFRGGVRARGCSAFIEAPGVYDACCMLKLPTPFEKHTYDKLYLARCPPHPPTTTPNTKKNPNNNLTRNPCKNNAPKHQSTIMTQMALIYNVASSQRALLPAHCDR